MKKTQLIYFLGVLLLAFQWGCEKETEQPELIPDAGSSFTDIENDGYVVSLGAQPAPDGQLGTWRIYMGENGRLEDKHDAQTKFYGEPGETYLLGWELSQGSDYKATTINVSFKPLKPVLLTSVTDTVHNNISLHLNAEAPRFGAEGRWEIISGEGGRIENATDPEAQFIGEAFQQYTVRWVLSYGSKEASVDLNFTTDELRAQAGIDQLDIITSGNNTKFYTLNGFLPAGATGQWEVDQGEFGTVFSPDNPNSLFEGVADSVYSLTWTVDLDGIQAVDTVQVRFRGKWGMWTDPKDGQTYRYAEVNGLEWMAENYNYAVAPGTGSRYYGQSERAVIKDGYPLETEEDRKFYGRMYNWYTAYDATPEGWRLPTYSEFEDLLVHLGGPIYAGEKVKLGGETGIDLNYGGYFDLFSWEDPAIRAVFQGLDEVGVFWTADYQPDKEKSSCYVVIPESEQPGYALLSAYYASVSVRYVREVSN
jgi:uncharacterized protein (TIGR02145 family)